MQQDEIANEFIIKEGESHDIKTVGRSIKTYTIQRDRTVHVDEDMESSNYSSLMNEQSFGSKATIRNDKDYQSESIINE